ncbi:MAG: hypothetical protein ABTB30_04780 [Clostridia bacterium]
MSEKKEKKERFSQVSNEVAEKARSCKTHEELMQLLKDNNIELTPRQMEIVAGGGCNPLCDNDCITHCQGTCATCGKNC